MTVVLTLCRKYKTQIEDFVQQLIEQDASGEYETLQKLDLKVTRDSQFTIICPSLLLTLTLLESIWLICKLLITLQDYTDWGWAWVIKCIWTISWLNWYLFNMLIERELIKNIMLNYIEQTHSFSAVFEISHSVLF